MKRIKWVGLLGAVILPAVLSAGTIQLGTSTSTLSFDPPALTAGNCVSATNVCTITGTGSLQGVPEQYSIVTTLSGALGSGIPITWSGSGPNYTLDEHGASIAFSFNDGPVLGDTLAGTVTLNSMSTSTSPQDATDIFATITFTSVNLPTTARRGYLSTNYGALPTVNGTASLDLTVSCNTGTSPNIIQNPCIPLILQDPLSTSVSASISPGTQSTVPEPASIALLGCGLAAIAVKLKRRK